MRATISLLATLLIQPALAAEPGQPAIENLLGMKFVMIPSGEFLMGSDESPEALAGTRTRYHSGDDPQSLPAVGNVFDADAARNWSRWKTYALAGHDGFAFTAPIDSFAPNAFGLYDMHGNVWEWCADWHGDDYYAQSPLDDPQGPAAGTVRVRRGGSWHTWPFYARSAYRNWNAPQTRYTLVGFRLVREADADVR